VLGEAEFSVGVEEGLLADAPPGFEQLREQPRMRRLGDHRLVAVIGQVAVSAIDVAKRRQLDNQRIDARHAASCSRPETLPAWSRRCGSRRGRFLVPARRMEF
jgi:hypothetical protein